MVLRRWFGSSSTCPNNPSLSSRQRDAQPHSPPFPDHVLSQPYSQVHARSTRANVLFCLAVTFLGLMLITWIALHIRNAVKQQCQETRELSARPDSQIARPKSPVVEASNSMHVPSLNPRYSNSSTDNMTTGYEGSGSLKQPTSIAAPHEGQSARPTIRRRRKPRLGFRRYMTYRAEDDITSHNPIEHWLATEDTLWAELALAQDRTLRYYKEEWDNINAYYTVTSDYGNIFSYPSTMVELMSNPL